MKWLKWMKSASKAAKAGGQGADAHGLLGRDAFQRELQRHRALCNRAGGQFILMVFEAQSSGKSEAKRASMEKLTSVISRRVRVSDVAGRYEADSNNIGVILPHTDRDGAERFLKAVEDLMRRSMNGSWTPDFKLKCDMFVYPELRSAVMVATDEPAASKSTVLETR